MMGKVMKLNHEIIFRGELKRSTYCKSAPDEFDKLISVYVRTLIMGRKAIETLCEVSY